MFQRLAQFCIALLLDLPEQPDVLDGNHGLSRKGLEQFDLSVRRRDELPFV